ncbi:hypothetical protein [Shewanella waksmanii]
MDAVVERPWMGLQRAEEVSAYTPQEAKDYHHPQTLIHQNQGKKKRPK